MDNDTSAPGSFADVAVPDSRLARPITEFIRDTEPDLLFHHSSRVYHFGAMAGRRRGLEFDPELLYAGAMFHDIGLIPAHSSPDERFEVDGANAARDFLLGHGITSREVETVWTAIALHTTPGIPRHMHPVVALVTAGVEMDVLGIGYHGFTDAEREAVVRVHPRGDHFKDDILEAFYQGHPAQAGDHLRQRQGRRPGAEGPGVPSRRLLQRHPELRLGQLIFGERRTQPGSMNYIAAGFCERLRYDRSGSKDPGKFTSRRKNPALPVVQLEKARPFRGREPSFRGMNGRSGPKGLTVRSRDPPGQDPWSGQLFPPRHGTYEGAGLATKGASVREIRGLSKVKTLYAPGIASDRFQRRRFASEHSFAAGRGCQLCSEGSGLLTSASRSAGVILVGRCPASSFEGSRRPPPGSTRHGSAPPRWSATMVLAPGARPDPIGPLLSRPVYGRSGAGIPWLGRAGSRSLGGPPRTAGPGSLLRGLRPEHQEGKLHASTIVACESIDARPETNR